LTDPTRSRWEPKPEPGDGPDARGEAGSPGEVAARRVTEEAAETGRFPQDGELRDGSNPIEPEEPIGR